MITLEQIRIKASKNPKRIVFPEPQDERILQAIKEILERKIAKPIIICKEKERIKEYLKNAGMKENEIEGAEIIYMSEYEKREEYEKKYYELRKHKGEDLEKAKKTLEDSVYFGTMMIEQGDADGLVSGSLTPTSHTLRPAFKIIKTMPEISVASGAVLMVPPAIFSEHKPMLMADCAVVPNPTSQELFEIARTSAFTAQTLFDMKPKVALLSFSTKGSAEHPMVQKVRRAAEIAKEKGFKNIDGELQADAAINKAIAKRKAPNSEIAGEANVLIFPDLNSGNIAHKLVQELGRYRVVGPIIQGLKKPVNDLSRGCKIEDIIDVTAITVIQAQSQEKSIVDRIMEMLHINK